MGLFDKHFANGDTATCTECGRVLPVTELSHVDDYGWVCSQCSSASDLVRCVRCYELYAPDDCSKLDDGTYVCMDCDSDLYWSTHE